MAWLVIRVLSSPVPTAWKAGDIIEVRDDAYVERVGWGRLEGLPFLYRVHVADLDAGRIKGFLESQHHEGTGGEKRLVRVRKWGLRVHELPATAREQLQRTGIAEMTAQQIVGVVKDDNGNGVVLP